MHTARYHPQRGYSSNLPAFPEQMLAPVTIRNIENIVQLNHKHIVSAYSLKYEVLFLAKDSGR